MILPKRHKYINIYIHTLLIAYYAMYLNKKHYKILLNIN